MAVQNWEILILQRPLQSHGHLKGQELPSNQVIYEQ